MKLLEAIKVFLLSSCTAQKVTHDSCKKHYILVPVGICAFAIVSLFLSFFVNYWGVAGATWFATYQSDSESYIIGRLVQSKQHGIFSSGGLPGFGSLDATPVRFIDQPFANQYLAYMNDLPFGTYTTTHSQIGGQGIFFSLLDRWITASPKSKLHFFYALTALLTALMIAAMIVWFYLEFGLTVSIFVLLSALFSQWLVVFGRNLWWSLWSFYLPVVAVMYYLRFTRVLSTVQIFTLGSIAFITLFIKCVITGYEYITTTLVMTVVPVIYYTIRNRVNFQQALKTLAIVGFGSCLGILLSFGILCLQIASVQGDFWAGVNHIIYSFQKRTHIEPIAWEVGDSPSAFAASLEASTIAVLGKYLVGTYFDATNYLAASPFVSQYLLKIRYIYLIILFMFMSLVLYFRQDQQVATTEERKQRALLYTTWFSILAPLSWFVIFKAHSYVHTHMNFIVWQMPFVFFGFASCGLVVKKLLPHLHSLAEAPQPPTHPTSSTHL